MAPPLPPVSKSQLPTSSVPTPERAVLGSESARRLLLVIHQEAKWPRLGHFGDQAEHGQHNQEAIRRPHGAHTEHRPQRIAPAEAADARRGGRIGTNNWCKPAKANSISDWTPVGRVTRQPDACSGNVHADFPIPVPHM